MKTVSVIVNGVHCHKTEDNTGADEIYLIGAMAKSIGDLADPNKAAIGRLPKIATIPNPTPGGTPTVKAVTQSMNNGDKWHPNTTLIKDTVADGPVVIGLWLLDQDASEDVDVEKLEKIKAAITASATALAAETSGVSVPAGGVAIILMDFIALAMAMDDDDLLGYTDPFVQLHVVSNAPAGGFPPGWNPGVTATSHKFKANLDGANYDVYFTVLVGQ